MNTNTQGFFRMGSDRVGLVTRLVVTTTFDFPVRKLLKYTVHSWKSTEYANPDAEAVVQCGEFPIENRSLTRDDLEARVIHQQIAAIKDAVHPAWTHRGVPHPRRVRINTVEAGVVDVRVLPDVQEEQYERTLTDRIWQVGSIVLSYYAELVNGVLEKSVERPADARTIHDAVPTPSLSRTYLQCAEHYLRSIGLTPISNP